MEIIKLIEVVSGSRLYGTSFQNSDQDKIVVFLYKNEDKISGNLPLTYREGDTRFYELGKFVELLIAGDINCHEVLWADYEYVKYINPRFEILTTKNRVFLSEEILNIWLDHAEYLFNKAVRLGSLKLEDKTIMDFLSVIYFSHSYGTETYPFPKAIERGSFDPHTTIKYNLKLSEYGITVFDKSKNLYAVWQDYGIPQKNFVLSGIFKDDKLVLDDITKIDVNDSRSTFSFKALLNYDAEGHKKYLKFKTMIQDNKIVRGYAPKSMYHAFRILDIVNHYLNHNRIQVVASRPTLLMDIRKGNFSVEQLKDLFYALFNTVKERLSRTAVTSTLDLRLIARLTNKCKGNIEEKNTELQETEQ